MFAPLWLSAAIYRCVADPYLDEPTHRNMLKAVFSDQPPNGIDEVVDAMIGYGVIREDDATDEAVGDLSVVPYEVPDGHDAG